MDTALCDSQHSRLSNIHRIQCLRRVFSAVFASALEVSHSKYRNKDTHPIFTLQTFWQLRS